MINTCKNIDRSQKHFVERKNADNVNYAIISFMLISRIEKPNLCLWGRDTAWTGIPRIPFMRIITWVCITLKFHKTLEICGFHYMSIIAQFYEVPTYLSDKAYLQMVSSCVGMETRAST